MAITSIVAQQRLDSRGKPTVQVRLKTSAGVYTSLVPSGASKGDYEAVELRDGDSRHYDGNTVLDAVHNVNEILGPAVIESGLDPASQLQQIDKLMIDLDGTDDKRKLGANATLGISMAAARAGASAKGVPLYEFLAAEASMPIDEWIMPVPFFNVLHGGDHSRNTMPF